MTKKIEAIVFDLAGTIIDFGSLAPSKVLIHIFNKFGITISRKEAVGPMGIEKRAHISQLINSKKISLFWKKKYNKKPGKQEIDKLFKLFNPELKKIIKHHSKLISGCKKTINFLKRKKIKLAVNTGYSEEILKIILSELKKQGFYPDISYSSSHANIGRPSAEIIYKIFSELNITMGSNCIKVDDTIPGLLEGVNAGMWVVGVIFSGNEFGKTEVEFNKLSSKDKIIFRKRVTNKFKRIGAHYVIDTIKDLPKTIELIDSRIK
tara:strand:- start:425 stop:1216 length:792 start_codon:yes stop_codon:yes gene_type:complete